MFISNAEKEKINEGITLLCAEVAKLKTDIVYLKAKIKVLENNPAPKPKKVKTLEQKAKQREYMRRYKAKKAAEAKLAKAVA
jgi:hypothetical protein